MPAPTSTVTQANVNQQTNGLYADNGALISDGAGNVTSTGNIGSATQSTSGLSTLNALTVTANFLLTAKKLGITAAGDLADYSGAQALRKLGPTSTTLRDAIQASSTNWTDTNGNNITSHSKFSGSTNAATAHNYAVATPNFVSTMVTGTATATSYGTFTATQVTPAMTSAAAYTALASLE